MTVTDQPTLREASEAKVRRLMAQRAALPLTWETRGERAELLVEINAELERWNRLA